MNFVKGQVLRFVECSSPSCNCHKDLHGLIGTYVIVDEFIPELFYLMKEEAPPNGLHLS